jgi:methylenetetrahydrofolate reductase (NADPH)
MIGRMRSPPATDRSEQVDIAALARDASVEMTWHDVEVLPICQASLARDAVIFVSHLPGQTWEQTVATCAAVRDHGFQPVPHIPARRLQDLDTLRHLASELARRAQIRQALVIAGDSADSIGPFATTLDVLATGVLPAHGIRSIVVAAYPEGHPRIGDDELRKGERDKVAYGAAHGQEIVFLTQFFFDPAPFLAWVGRLRAAGIKSRVVAGVAGPAQIATLFRYAVRCGVGPSVRALGTRPGSFARLLGERGPEIIVRTVADTNTGSIGDVGLHVYSFGGLVRTCRWLRAVADGRFGLDDVGGFTIDNAALG